MAHYPLFSYLWLLSVWVLSSDLPNTTTAGPEVPNSGGHLAFPVTAGPVQDAIGR